MIELKERLIVILMNMDTHRNMTVLSRTYIKKGVQIVTELTQYTLLFIVGTLYVCIYDTIEFSNEFSFGVTETELKLFH